MVEFWTTGLGLPAVIAKAAARAEEQGWDGFGTPYAPTMAPDPYVSLSTAAGWGGGTRRWPTSGWLPRQSSSSRPT